MTDIVTIHYCSFCGKNNHDSSVAVIVTAYKEAIAGIFNICIDLCNTIIAEKMQSRAENTEATDGGGK